MPPRGANGGLALVGCGDINPRALCSQHWAHRSAPARSPLASPAGLGVWGTFLFLVVFPFGKSCNRALYGWLGALRRSYGPAVLLPALPAVILLATLQLVMAVIAVLNLVLFGVFGAMYAMCVYGALTTTLAYDGSTPELSSCPTYALVQQARGAEG